MMFYVHFHLTDGSPAVWWSKCERRRGEISIKRAPCLKFWRAHSEKHEGFFWLLKLTVVCVVIKKSETERAGGVTLLHSRWAVGPPEALRWLAELGSDSPPPPSPSACLSSRYFFLPLTLSSIILHLAHSPPPPPIFPPLSISSFSVSSFLSPLSFSLLRSVSLGFYIKLNHQRVCTIIINS